MARKILSPLDFTKNEIQNAVLHVLAAAPGSPVEGQHYYNSTSKRWEFRTDTAWIDPTARASHSGTQLASTISDFSTAADARIAAAVGVSVQALDADLTAIAGLAATAGMLSRTGAGAFAVRTLSSGTTALTIADPTGAAGNPTISVANAVAAGAAGLMTGADKTKLDGIATGATANDTDANLKARANHTGTQLASTISDFDTQVRTSRLDQMASPTAAVSLNSQRITNLAIATTDSDAAQWGQVKSLVNGLDWKPSVRALVTTNVTIASPGATLDGLTMSAGERVVLNNQSTGSQNGPWVWNGAASAMTRPDDWVTGNATGGATWPVEEGTSADKLVICTTNGAITVDTTSTSFTSLTAGGSYVAGDGLTESPAGTFNVGAGTGITVNANDVAINTAVVARKYTALNTAGGTSWTVNHALANQWVHVQIIEVATLKQVEAEIELTDANNVTITFAASQTANAFRAIVIG